MDRAVASIRRWSNDGAFHGGWILQFPSPWPFASCFRCSDATVRLSRKSQSEIHAPVQPPLERLEESDRLIRRTEKLLALAESDNEHEALAAMKKVQELYAKHQWARLEKGKSTNYRHLTIKTQKRRLERYQYVIASILNEHFFVEVIHCSQFNSSQCVEFRAIELLGTDENVEMAEYVYHFLMHQIERLWQGRKNTLNARRSRASFMLGVASGFRNKLDKQKEIVVTENRSTDLVSLKDPELTRFLASRHPRLSKIQSGGRLGDSRAYQSGKKAGESITLHRGVKRGTGFLGKLLNRPG